MAHTTSPEATFKSYAPSQAAAYAALRGSYHSNLFDVILNHHKSTGGSFGTLLDVGCGPGNSTRPLAKHFDTAYGIDPSPEMINTAVGISEKAESGETVIGKRIDFVMGRAEEMKVPGWEDGRKVDMITAGMAAHWFDMSHFWATAAQKLNKGGTVALWTSASYHCHPSTPNAARVQETLFILERKDLAPYELPGNRLARDGYANLPLPWTVDPPVAGFSAAGLTRQEWDRDGVLSDGEHFFLGDERATLDQVQKHLGTASMVTRWREANPDLVGTEKDVVAKMIEELRELLGPDVKTLIAGRSCHLLLFKKI